MPARSNLSPLFHSACHAAITLSFIVLAAFIPRPIFAATCTPTEPDALGPFYKAGAPERESVGKGYVLMGMVKSSADCSAVKGARIELWLAGPDGGYGDDYRAIVFSDASGSYRFQSNFPPAYAGRPPHIHLRVSAKGFETLVTQHYPAKGKTEATFDLVLVPAQ
jgi:protocatechuate 3,4-dioxygenase beta subunit